MQKIIIKYTSVIMAVGILFILFFNFGFMLHNLQKGKFENFRDKIEQMAHTLENNRTELEMMQKNLDMDYLTRARAAAYVLDSQQEVSMDAAQMQYLAELLDVDELHIIDENGIIVSSSVPDYIGIDMANHKQTREFLPLLEQDDDAYLIQEEQPNAAEGRIMKYVGVRRKHQKGIVQVGFKPVRQMEVQLRNSYEYIFSRFPTDMGEELFVVDMETGGILGHSDGIEQEFTEEYYQLDVLLTCAQGAYKKGRNGQMMYVVSKQYGDILICTALPRNILLRQLWVNIFLTLLYLLLVEAVVIFSLNYLVRRKVINGIHNIIGNLSAITKGNLDIRVKEEGNPEFGELSSGINAMVDSIVNISGRISRIIEMSGVPLAAFEYESGTGLLFVTAGLKRLLALPEEEAKKICADSDLFERYISGILENQVEGETDIYKVNDRKYIRIHMSRSEKKCLGVITEATQYLAEKQRMQYENTHDPLTGLYKYPHFQLLAQKVLQNLTKGKMCAAVMLDLDSFKSINDTFGHDMGDKYLQSFAAVLQSLPEEHVIPARRSGDEFCMMLYDCKDKKELTGYLDLLYEKLRGGPVALSDRESRIIGVSCGFAWTVEPGMELTQLLAHADSALYERKRESKGGYREYTG